MLMKFGSINAIIEDFYNKHSDDGFKRAKRSKKQCKIDLEDLD